MASKDSFKRSLSLASLDKLLSDPAAQAILHHADMDPELSVFLRGSYLDVYWQGYVVFEIRLPRGGLQIGSTSEKKPADFPRTLAQVDLGRVGEFSDWVKQRRGPKARAGSDELMFESNVVRDNRSKSSPALAIDRQIVRPGYADRLDLVMLDVGERRLVLAELKASGNAEASGKVLDQLERYRKTFTKESVLEDYKLCLGQMQTLGIIPNRSATLEDQSPLLVIMLAGYDVERLGARATRGHFVKLLSAKKRDYPGADVRLLTFPAINGSFAIPTPLGHLPTIERWCDLYI